MAVNPVPSKYHTVTPYLVVAEVDKLIEFLKVTFRAEVVEHHRRPDGKTAHAEVKIGDSIVMMGEPNDQWKAMNGSLYVYLDEVDGAYRRAVAAGAKVLSEPADMLYGDRTAGVIDLAGNIWWLATHFEDVPPDELKRRMQTGKK